MRQGDLLVAYPLYVKLTRYACIDWLGERSVLTDTTANRRDSAARADSKTNRNDEEGHWAGYKGTDQFHTLTHMHISIIDMYAYNRNH